MKKLTQWGLPARELKRIEISRTLIAGLPVRLYRCESPCLLAGDFCLGGLAGKPSRPRYTARLEPDLGPYPAVCEDETAEALAKLTEFIKPWERVGDVAAMVFYWRLIEEGHAKMTALELAYGTKEVRPLEGELRC